MSNKRPPPKFEIIIPNQTDVENSVESTGSVPITRTQNRGGEVFEFPLWSFDSKEEADAPMGMKYLNTKIYEELTRRKINVNIRALYSSLCREQLNIEPPENSLDRFMLAQLMLPVAVGDNIWRCGKARRGNAHVLRRELLASIPIREKHNHYKWSVPEVQKKITDFLTKCQWWYQKLSKDEVFTQDRDLMQMKELMSELAFFFETSDHGFRNRFAREQKGGPLITLLRELVGPYVDAVTEKLLTAIDEELEQAEEPAEASSDLLVSRTLDDRGGWQLSFCNEHPLHISNIHFMKLRQLFVSRNCHRKDSGEPLNDLFLTFLYCVYCRYTTMMGLTTREQNSIAGSMHCATPEYLMYYFKKIYGVSAELFASPFNCYFNTFCSAFPDLDAIVGSQGSFFEYDIPEGHYQVAPPYTEEVMLGVSHKLLKALKSPKKYVFIVVVPKWTNCEALDLLDGVEAEPFRLNVRGSPSFQCKPSEYLFITGVQFFKDKENGEGRYYVPPHGTLIYFLTNDTDFKHQHEPNLYNVLTGIHRGHFKEVEIYGKTNQYPMTRDRTRPMVSPRNDNQLN